MAPFKKTTVDKKKKGPKGKKARAKAKLDRQWGEETVDKSDSKARRGKSRLLSAKKKKSDDREEIDASQLEQENGSAPKYEFDDDISVDSSDDNESDTEAAPLTNLLQSIRRKKSVPKKKARVVQDEDSDDMDENKDAANNDEVMEEEDDSQADVESESELEAEEDDDDYVEHAVENQSDLFGQRFSREPLLADELTSNKPLVKIPVDASLELHVVAEEGDLQSRLLKMKADKDGADKDALQSISRESFECNRQVLQRQWKSKQKNLSRSQYQLYPFLSRYMDSLVTTDSTKHRNEMHSLYMLHLLNHILTSRGRIQRNNKQLKEGEEKKTDEKSSDKEDEEEEIDSKRDQGYTRPTVLVLLPTRGTCYTFINQLMKMVGTEVDEEHKDRFETDFGPMKDEEAAELDPGNERRRKEILKKKGSSWNELFGDEVNQDDDFKMGISLTPKAAKTNAQGDMTKKSNVQVKLYTNFYKSDLIVTSPLGLKMLTTPEDEDKDADIDFLSSIEICLLEYADVMLMQNWDHVNDIISLLNQEPRNNNSTDFSRVRNYLLEGQGANWRQLIVSSSITDPSLLSTFKRNAKSLSGSVKVRRRVAPENAAISNVLDPVKQVFQQVSSTSFEQQSDARLSYFTKTILPHILRQKQKHTMIYIPSYFDFCSVRNVFLKRDIDFVTVNEYSRGSEITRGRARFLQGRKPIMLYTGRGHFFHRHLIKGVRHLIFFGLPEHANFYSEQVNLLETSNGAEEDDLMAASTVSSCLALFTKYDAHSLERAVGSSNCNRMISSEKSTFMFYS